MYGTSTGPKTGVSTPRSASSLRPLTLSHGSLEHTILLPANIHYHASQMKERFSAILPAPTDELAQDDEPSSEAELVARYMAFVAQEVENGEDDAQGSYEDVLKIILSEFERAFLQGNEVHALASTLPGIQSKKLIVIRSYYAAKIATGRPFKPHESALFRAVGDKHAKVFSIFGGQGNTEDYFDELREMNDTYPAFLDGLISSAADLLRGLSKHPQAEKLYSKDLDILGWLQHPENTPDVNYLISAPVSFPLIGLVQLAHYTVSCKVLGFQPHQFRDKISGTTGHSQGIVLAAILAAADTWESFEKLSITALTILFWIGARSQQIYPITSLAPSILQDSESNGEGVPTPMLSIRDLPRKQVQDHVNLTNQYLPEDRHVAISLVNSAHNMVVTGPPISLYGLNLQLRKFKAATGVDQTRIPFTERKVRFQNRFLPVTSPFHSKYIESATQLIDSDLQDVKIDKRSLMIPVYNTNTGRDIREEVDGNIVPLLVRLITKHEVDWEKATTFPGASHVLDFGPGGISGLGVLTSRNKDGTGVRVILAGTLDGTVNEVGYKSELFDRDEQNAVKYAVDWVREHGPRLVKTSFGRTYVDTKMSRLLGLPPVMVAGMTPCTVCTHFVSCTMNAGYHIELAGGGYYNAKQMTEALHVIREATCGRGISVNLIYVNPRAMQWQIPLVGKLRSEGVPIEGLTIGAGVPSTEIAQEYIETLGLKHISFKPGSVESIQAVINIAKANPKFPIMLQWTGGRGGGHHSYEDFHQPILQMYGRIRRCENLILIAGSGFGGADDTYPYLTGVWSNKFGYPPMPFDGCLFGSRVMTAKEVRTSLNAKKAITEAEGLDDSEWEKTYKGPAGGVITVRSEMGEPIHKLATRGVLFWAEMDAKIFSLPKEKRLPELKKNRSYIIKKLNDDFQKVWFGRNKEGEAVDLEDMTYAEVINRMVELMHVSFQNRWIDKSYVKLVRDFIQRVEERFATKPERALDEQVYSLKDNPRAYVSQILLMYPDAESQLINAQDVQYFLLLCQRRGQKPTTFVPSLDENFEFYFKKDSLWQSEDLSAVIDQDVGRTCILQGPTAVKYSKVVNEPIKDILDGVHNGHIKALTRDVYGGKEDEIPVLEYFGATQRLEDRKIDIEGLVISHDNDRLTIRLSASPSTPLPSEDDWFSLLAGHELSWRYALFTSKVFVKENKFETNPMKRIFAPARGLYVEIKHPNKTSETTITLSEQPRANQYVKVVEIEQIHNSEITVNLIKDVSAAGKPIKLPLKYIYDPKNGYTPIKELTLNRNARVKNFYWKAWFGNEPCNLQESIRGKFHGGTATITSESINDFVHAVGNMQEAFVERPGKDVLAPMDFAIVVGWKAIIKPIFPEKIDGDLLCLVHLSNGFRMMPGAEPLKKGDVVETTAQINAVLIQESGLMVEVCGTICRDRQAVMDVTSQFLYRGEYSDFSNAFQRKVETPMQIHLATTRDVAVLRSKQWFLVDEPDHELLGQTLTFRLQSFYKFQNQSVYSRVETTGQVLLELPTKKIIQVATVDYESDISHGNPVIDYLQRHGSSIEQPVMFENAIPLSGKTPLNIRAPASNETYARVSGDYNPIHVSRIFSSYASLPGTITHGMYTSASVRSLVETWAAENEIGRVRSYHASFTGMVLPNDEIEVSLQHVGMVAGRKIIKVQATKKDTDEKVLIAEAEVEQPVSAYVFTGQGSQEQGMGMDLYNSSAVAKEVWDRADKHFMDNYGFAITNIVKNNPKELTIYFGGPRGKAIRQNYISMTFETVGTDGSTKSERIFKGINENTTSYTYMSPTGLLSATQFTQPALTLMEKASFEDMRSKGLVQRESSFAGHSLGEYSALAALAEVMPIESLVSVVFYRGLTMQVAVERDEAGRSNYSMCAVNPSRISETFNEQALQYVVENISEETGWLLEIVNYNVANMQYVCAGDLRALDTLAGVTNYLKVQKIDIQQLTQTLSIEDVRSRLVEIITESAVQTKAKPQPVELQRGYATIPLKGIDVPFHSTFLRSGVKPFRSFLLKKINRTSIDPSKLIGKYIPNVTARPFQITKEYFEDVYRLTNSPKIGAILSNWSRYEDE